MIRYSVANEYSETVEDRNQILDLNRTKLLSLLRTEIMSLTMAAPTRDTGLH
jgi:hypothetical protein